jgi:hypothetical protein
MIAAFLFSIAEDIVLFNAVDLISNFSFNGLLPSQLLSNNI